MVTMALTSVPPSGRNSFWYTSAVNSAMIDFLSSWLIDSVCPALCLEGRGFQQAQPARAISHTRQRY
jgi:hypothetical protein